MKSLFFYGSLRDRALLEIVLDHPVADEAFRPARAADVATVAVAGEGYPMLTDRPGAMAEGMLFLGASAEDVARLEFFEEAEYGLAPLNVETAEGPVEALVFRPTGKPQPAGGLWDYAEWQRVERAPARHAARELMHHMGLTPVAEIDRYWPGIKIRALQHARAAETPSPAGEMRSAFGRQDLEIAARDRAYTSFLAVHEMTLRHRRFDGTMTPALNRSAVVWGDAVTVLPWDPLTDRVQLIEQFRPGPAARGDPNPWCIEVVAGRIDRNESAEAVARREAAEEGGLTLGRLAEIGGQYATPGLAAEHLTQFVGEADLSAARAGLHGCPEEGEDIRTLIVTLEEALAAVDRGEVNTGPALVSLLWLARHRDRLARDWRGDPLESAAATG